MNWVWVILSHNMVCVVFFSLPLMCCKSSQLWCFYFHTLMQFHNLCPMNFYLFIYKKIEKKAFWESSVWQNSHKMSMFLVLFVLGLGGSVWITYINLPMLLYFFFFLSDWALKMMNYFLYIYILVKKFNIPPFKKVRMRYIEYFQNLLLLKYQWPYFTNEVCAGTGTPFQQ